MLIGGAASSLQKPRRIARFDMFATSRANDGLFTAARLAKLENEKL